jgi:hypothetical protein
MSFWPLLGFKQSPYATNPVPSDEDGEKLLVGREAEVDDLVELVSGTTGHAVVGGANGVGKSSLIAVVTHQLRQIDEGPSGPLFLSLRRPINVSPSSTTESIREEATLMLAQGLIDHQQTLRRAGRRLPDLEPLEHWLNSPTVKGRGGGVTTPLGGLNASTSETVNAGQGFSRLGVFDLVLEGVRASASADQSGGFVAVLDNLELYGLAVALARRGLPRPAVHDPRAALDHLRSRRHRVPAAELQAPERNRQPSHHRDADRDQRHAGGDRQTNRVLPDAPRPDDPGRRPSAALPL